MRTFKFLLTTCLVLTVAATALAQGGVPRQGPAPGRPATVRDASTPSASVAAGDVPADYVIGPEDVLAVMFWRDQEMTGEVAVRPDGMITLPLIGDVKATGMRPDTLSDEIRKAADKYVTDPSVTVVVRQINSRKVFITGLVATPGAYPLTGPRTVMQLIALAGGLTEYADSENITVMRQEQGRSRAYRFNYKLVAKGQRLEQNLALQPGDTVVVP